MSHAYSNLQWFYWLYCKTCSEAKNVECCKSLRQTLLWKIFIGLAQVVIYLMLIAMSSDSTVKLAAKQKTWSVVNLFIMGL